MNGGSRPKTLDFPFFTLEYRNGLFLRRVPGGVVDMGGGVFRQGGETWKLPAGEDAAALAKETVTGRPLLSLLNRGPNSLIKQGPRLAREGERLMELSLVRAAGAAIPAAGGVGAGPLAMELRTEGAEAEWLPLAGLPHHRLYRGVIYEIVDEAAVSEYAEARVMRRYTLRGEDIPGFVDSHSRMIFQFGDQTIRELLAEDSVFVNRDRLSLVLSAAAEQRRGGIGEAWASPLLRYGDRRYPAGEVSLRMNREYILLEDQWARREDLEAAGIFPLRAYAGGEAIEQVRLKPGELLRRGGGRFAGRWSGMEADTTLWLERGGREAVFQTHLEFLCAWGLSGGVVINGHREQAAFLVSALVRLASGADYTLALMERRYYDLYLSPFLAELQAAHIILPGAAPESRSAVVIAFYENLPLTPAEQRNAAGILALIEPEEVLDRDETFARLRSIRAGIKLGVFSAAWELFRGPAAARARNLFGVPEAELEPYLVRDVTRPLSLPRFEFPPPRILRPSALSPEQNLFTYTVEEKFAGLSGPSLYSELALFKTSGPPAPFVPLRLLKGSLDIERMDAEERSFFMYWRSEFRRGNIIKTGEAYIRVYARELCLFTGGEAESDASFRELYRLWECYRPVFENLNGFLPRWLIDFAVLFEMTDEVFPALLPYTRECNDPLLTDIYLHQHFIRENNSIDFADIALLVPGVISESVCFNREAASRETAAETPRLPVQNLIRDFELVVNAIDRYLREEFRLKLFEFFYPQVYDAEKREAFPAMERAGRSAYMIAGLRFTRHPPLIGFLESLFHYTEYCFKFKNGLEMKGKAPPLGEIWKRVADTALGLAEAAVVPPSPARPIPLFNGQAGPARSDQPPGTRPPSTGRPVRLLESRIEKLRADSTVVREMLKIEDAGQNNGNVPLGNARGPDKPPIRRTTGSPHTAQPPLDAAIKGFLSGLDELERESLRIISGAGKPGLDDFARKSGTMPELLIDRINAAFLEQFADLLIDTVDERPAIQSEYKGILKNLLGTPAGDVMKPKGNGSPGET